jgi:hypothetical protein
VVEYAGKTILQRWHNVGLVFKAGTAPMSYDEANPADFEVRYRLYTPGTDWRGTE